MRLIAPLLALATMALLLGIATTAEATAAPGPDGSTQKYRAIDNNGMAPPGVPNAGYAKTPPSWSNYQSIQVGGSTVPGPGGQVEDDEWSSSCLSLGFTFQYYGQNQNCVYVAGEGLIGMSSTTRANPAANAPAIPNGGNPNNVIIPFWGYQNGAWCGGDVKYKRDTAANPDRFIVQWNNVMMWSNGPDSVGCAANTVTPPHPYSTFQVVLEAETNNIYFYIDEYNSNNGNTAYCSRSYSSGIENSGGNQGLQYYRHQGTCTAGAQTDFTITDRVVRFVPNHGPTVTASNMVGNEDNILTTVVTATDADGDNVASYRIDTTGLTFGSASISGATITYTPGANQYGNAGNIVVYAKDTLGTEGPAKTITVTVNPVNDGPSFDAGSAVSVDANSAAYLESWASNTFISPTGEHAVEPDTATYSVTPIGTAASLFAVQPSMNETGWLSFTPGLDQVGIGQFDVTLSDGAGTTEAHRLRIELVQTYVPPVAQAATIDTDEDIAGSTTLSAENPMGATLMWSITSEPSEGTASIVGDEVTYTPAANWFGSDGFTVEVTDGQETSSTIVTVTVQPVNDAPEGADDSLQVVADSITTIGHESLLENDGDIDGDALTISSVTGTTQGGTISLAGYNIEYSPPLGFVGTDTFTYELSDGELTATASVALEVIPADQLPPDVDFTWSDGVLTNSVPITFTDATIVTSHAIASHAWDFGDGATSDDKNPVHTYAFTGQFEVSLTVTDINGNAATTTKSLLVTNQFPVVIAVPIPPNVGLGEKLVLTSLSQDDGPILTTWLLNNMEVPSEVSMLTTGPQELTLRITDEHGFVNETSWTFTVVSLVPATASGGGGAFNYATPEPIVEAPPEPVVVAPGPADVTQQTQSTLLPDLQPSQPVYSQAPETAASTPNLTWGFVALGIIGIACIVAVIRYKRRV